MFYLRRRCRHGFALNRETQPRPPFRAHDPHDVRRVSEGAQAALLYGNEAERPRGPEGVLDRRKGYAGHIRDLLVGESAIAALAVLGRHHGQGGLLSQREPGGQGRR
jgi:hypothetical protein